MKKRMLAMVLTMLLVIGLCVPGAQALDYRAASVFVMDGQTGETLYEDGGDLARVPASMTKVMTAYIVYQELEKGTLTWQTPVKISHNVAVKSRDSDYPMAVPLTEGATYTVDTLMHLIMIPSASASCIAMAEHISGSEQAFVQRMNQTAKEMGLTATYNNCHGAQPNYITARSQARLTKIFIDTYPDILRITSKSSYWFNGRTYNNTNHLLNTLAPYEGLDGFKTGTISAAGYCVTTTAVRNGRRVIAVVMKSTSDNQRFADSRQLLDYGFAEIARRDAARAATTVSIPIQPMEITPFTQFSVTAAISGATSAYQAEAQWYLDGKPVEGYGNAAFQVTAGKTSTLTATLERVSDEPVQVSFVLTMPDGSTRRADAWLQVAPFTLSVDGTLNIEEATIYQGQSLQITAELTGANGLERVTLPAVWTLDGEVLPDQPGEITLERDWAECAYELEIPADMERGRYDLALTVGDEDSMGGEPLVLEADLRIIEPDD